MPPIYQDKQDSLKGKDMVTGGSINIPMDIRILATTISITIKGMYSMNPI